MQQTFLFESKNGNHYLFNKDKRKLTFVSQDQFQILKHLPKLDINEISSFFENNETFDSQIKDFFIPTNSKKFNNDLYTSINKDTIRKIIATKPHICFEVTELCNLDCKYCTYGEFYSGHTPRENRNLSVKAAQNVINEVFNVCKQEHPDYDNEINISFYGGEPLLRIDFLKSIVEYCDNISTNKMKFTYNMTTNATLLCKHIDFIVNHNFTLLVSLDGNEKNNGYRVFKDGKNSFSEIIKNLEFVKNKYPDYFSRKLKFNSVLHNKNSVVEITEFIKNNFNKQPAITELSTDGLKEEKRIVIEEMFRNKFEDLKQSEDYFDISDLDANVMPDFNDAIYFIFNLTDLVYPNYTELFLAKSRFNKPSGTCTPFSRKIFVTAAGLILACENIPHEFAYGSTYDNKIEMDYDKIASYYTEKLEHLSRMCTRCYRNTTCNQCMFYLNLNDSSLKCNGFMNSEKFKRYLIEIVSYIENNPYSYKKIIEEIALS